jgi:hypothetical protein
MNGIKQINHLPPAQETVRHELLDADGPRLGCIAGSSHRHEDGSDNDAEKENRFLRRGSNGSGIRTGGGHAVWSLNMDQSVTSASGQLTKNQRKKQQKAQQEQSNEELPAPPPQVSVLDIIRCGFFFLLPSTRKYKARSKRKHH